MTVKITLEVKQDATALSARYIELTVDEARDMYEQLKAIFGNDRVVYPPYCPPNWGYELWLDGAWVENEK